jgi:hypothetical protein
MSKTKRRHERNRRRGHTILVSSKPSPDRPDEEERINSSAAPPHFIDRVYARGKFPAPCKGQKLSSFRELAGSVAVVLLS